MDNPMDNYPGAIPSPSKDTILSEDTTQMMMDDIVGGVANGGFVDGSGGKTDGEHLIPVVSPANDDENDVGKLIGQLIVLGYNGSDMRNGAQKLCRMDIRKRPVGNGIKKIGSHIVSVAPQKAQSVRDSSRHTVSYSYARNHTVIVEYGPDTTKDLFQIGRCSEPQIDFTVVDTCLAAHGNAPYQLPNPVSQHRHHHHRNGASASPQGAAGSHRHSPAHRRQSSPNKAAHISMCDDTAKAVSSTISRYACRLLVGRRAPFSVHVYAAGFDAESNIFLGEKATKWTKKNNEMDGLTTNGILILHPNDSETNGHTEKPEDILQIASTPYVWHEVSVDGDIYTLRETRSCQKRGDLVNNDDNALKDGTLIDLCGATLLWRTADGLQRSPSSADLESRLDELNAGKPQCPVNLHTLVIPKGKRRTSVTRPNDGNRRLTGSAVSTNEEQSQPYVYIRCGHVQGKHAWGHEKVNDGGNDGSPANQVKHKCPICSQESPAIIRLMMGMESAFHLDSGPLEHAFNPCGHVSSLATVMYWSRIPLPHGTSSFRPVCPFCCTILSAATPYVRLIFQDHCYT